MLNMSGNLTATGHPVNVAARRLHGIGERRNGKEAELHSAKLVNKFTIAAGPRGDQ